MRLLFKWNDWPVLHRAIPNSHARTRADIKFRSKGICYAQRYCTVPKPQSPQQTFDWWLRGNEAPQERTSHNRGLPHNHMHTHKQRLCGFLCFCSTVKPCFYLSLCRTKQTGHLKRSHKVTFVVTGFSQVRKYKLFAISPFVLHFKLLSGPNVM